MQSSFYPVLIARRDDKGNQNGDSLSIDTQPIRSHLKLMEHFQLPMSDQPTLPGSLCNHEIDDYGICHLQITGPLAPGTTAAIARYVHARLLQDRPPAGIILDLRLLSLVSAVRLASLLDVLSNLGLPLAVLVGDERQRQIIVLLHNTLEHKEIVSYSTDLPTARGFILSSAGTPAAPPSHFGPTADRPL
jgi:hypothetical protein